MQIRGLVSKAGIRFLESRAVNTMPEEAIAKAMEFARNEHVGQFGLLIRQYASQFVEAGNSSAYWAMVDTASFYDDATGSYWPYMTMERREQALKWAGQDAASLLFGHYH